MLLILLICPALCFAACDSDQLKQFQDAVATCGIPLTATTKLQQFYPKCSTTPACVEALYLATVIQSCNPSIPFPPMLHIGAVKCTELSVQPTCSFNETGAIVTLYRKLKGARELCPLFDNATTDALIEMCVGDSECFEATKYAYRLSRLASCTIPGYDYTQHLPTDIGHIARQCVRPEFLDNDSCPRFQLNHLEYCMDYVEAHPDACDYAKDYASVMQKCTKRECRDLIVHTNSVHQRLEMCNITQVPEMIHYPYEFDLTIGKDDCINSYLAYHNEGTIGHCSWWLLGSILLWLY